MREKFIARFRYYFTRRAGITALLLLFFALLVYSARRYEGVSPGTSPAISVADRELLPTISPPISGADRGLSAATPPAFPGAEGWGAQSVGGRGGRVIEVTNLDDSGPSSLRACIEASGPRICVFRVGGIIELKSSIEVRNPYLTIAGQTAPGSGIYIRSAATNTEGINGLIKTPEFNSNYKGEFPHDIVIRYLRIRHGRSPTQKFDGTRPRNLDILSGNNIIIDHVSLGWVNDNLMTIMVPDKDGLPPIQYITVQRSILAESLEGHSTGLNIQGEGDGDRWQNVYNVTVHHNLFTNNGERNPRVTSAGAKIINNVVYNWNNHVGSTTRGSVVDWINNYWKFGPNSRKSLILLHEDRPGKERTPYSSIPSIYINGNKVSAASFDTATDNWQYYTLRFDNNAPLPVDYRRLTALPSAPIPETIQSADEAYDSVLNDVGANGRLDCAGNWVFNLDSIDGRILSEVRNNIGSKKTLHDENKVGGFPQITPASACPDADHDGMPDEWENKYDFDPSFAGDNSQDADGDRYTNIEEFLNGTDPREFHG